MLWEVPKRRSAPMLRALLVSRLDMELLLKGLDSDVDSLSLFLELEAVIDAVRQGKVWVCKRDDVDNSDREAMRKLRGPGCFGVPVLSLLLDDWCSLLKPYGKSMGKRAPMGLKLNKALYDEKWLLRS